MDDAHRHLVVGIGELLWDCFPEGRHPGGAPANVAFHAAQLGHRAAVCSRVGDDALGRELGAWLTRCGVDTGYIQTDSERPTGTVTVDASDPGPPTFVIHENAAWDRLAFDGGRGGGGGRLHRGADIGEVARVAVARRGGVRQRGGGAGGQPGGGHAGTGGRIGGPGGKVGK